DVTAAHDQQRSHQRGRDEYGPVEVDAALNRSCRRGDLEHGHQVALLDRRRCFLVGVLGTLVLALLMAGEARFRRADWGIIVVLALRPEQLAVFVLILAGGELVEYLAIALFRVVGSNEAGLSLPQRLRHRFFPVSLELVHRLDAVLLLD